MNDDLKALALINEIFQDQGTYTYMLKNKLKKAFGIIKAQHVIVHEHIDFDSLTVIATTCNV